MTSPPNPPLPPETQPAFWVPIVHYLLAAVLLVGAAAHLTLHISPGVQAAAVLASAVLTVVGTGTWFLIRYHGLNKTSIDAFAQYLRPVLQGLINDVETLKHGSPQVADWLATAEPRLKGLEATVANLRDALAPVGVAPTDAVPPSPGAPA